MRGIIISRKQNAGNGRMPVESPLAAKVRAEQERDSGPVRQPCIFAPVKHEDAGKLMEQGWRTTRQLAEVYGMSPSAVTGTMHKLGLSGKKAYFTHCLCMFYPPEAAQFLKKQAGLPTEPPRGWVTAKTVCLLLACSRKQLDTYIRTGKLAGEKTPIRTINGSAVMTLIFRKVDVLALKKTLKRR